MLSAIMSALGSTIVERLFSTVSGIIERYQQKQLSEVEAKKLITLALVGAVKDVEIAHADALAKTYESFQQTLRGSPIIQTAWVVLFIAQMIVIVWHQIGIPALCYTVGNMACYPQSGEASKWAYLMLMFMLGAGPIILRAGPGSETSLWDRFRSLIGR